jgi:hypothetical protein
MSFETECSEERVITWSSGRWAGSVIPTLRTELVSKNIVMAIAAPNGLNYYSSPASVPQLQDGGVGIFFAQLAKGAIDINMMLFFMNLLIPAYPLDAARMLASMGVHCGLSIPRAAWMIVIVGGLLGAGALIYGIIGLITGSEMGKQRKWMVLGWFAAAAVASH